MSQVPDDQDLCETRSILSTAAPSSSSVRGQSASPASGGRVTGVTGIDDDWRRFGDRAHRWPLAEELQRWGSKEVLPIPAAALATHGYWQLQSGSYMVRFSMVPCRSQADAAPILYDVEYRCNHEWWLPPPGSISTVVSVGAWDLATHERFTPPLFHVRVLNVQMEAYNENGEYHWWTVDRQWSGVLRRVMVPVHQHPSQDAAPLRGRGRGRGKGRGTVYQ